MAPLIAFVGSLEPSYHVHGLSLAAPARSKQFENFPFCAISSVMLSVNLTLPHHFADPTQ